MTTSPQPSVSAKSASIAKIRKHAAPGANHPNHAQKIGGNCHTKKEEIAEGVELDETPGVVVSVGKGVFGVEDGEVENNPEKEVLPVKNT